MIDRATSNSYECCCLIGDNLKKRIAYSEDLLVLSKMRLKNFCGRNERNRLQLRCKSRRFYKTSGFSNN